MLRRLESFLWRIGADADPAATLGELKLLYNHPPRAYHTLVHIDDCLVQLDLARHLARSPDAIEAAILFHDAVYDVREHDNEERSAAYARGWLREAGMPDSFSTQVHDLILASRHNGVPADEDAKLFTDIDLSILGRDWDTFCAYDKGIEAEYRPLYGDAYAAGRKAVLESFLKRPRIFSTAFFHDLYGQQAEENIRRRIAA